MTDPDKLEELRGLYCGPRGDGLAEVNAILRVDELAIVEQAMAKALPPKDGESPAGDSRVAVRRVDALVRICESYLAHGDGARNAPARNNAVVHVEVDRNGVISAETEAGLPVHPLLAERMLCDASVQGMLGDCGHPLGVGRTTQTISRKLRRALKKRSGGGCEWIGCDERRYVEAHHVWHWARGGPTELWNLVDLCWHHHHLVHKGGWRLEHDGRGVVRCYRPDGTELLHPVTPEFIPVLDVTTETDSIKPLWDGDRFDLSACVDVVLVANNAS